ncbi:MAG TPA: hypothetical protein VFM93_00095 [Candidatus Limnocylindria bacterium]|nr:hypothetical protein [Candidatus Limnocylindria bacterium]
MTTADNRAIAEVQASANSAYRWLVAAVVLGFLAFGVGAAWDRAWHTRNPFEDFWSPPHLFIYTTHLLATLALAKIAFTPDLRRHFGAPLRLPIVGDIPAALVFAGGGFAVIAVAGVLDSIWHTRFGLDETAWSLPHSMLGSGILLSMLGFVSARFALSDDRPLARWAPALFATVIVGALTGILLGPIDNNRTAEQVQAIARIPVLAATPEFQHTARIYLTWELMRTGPLFIPLAAFAAGVALAFARNLVGTWWAFLVVALAATLLSGDRDTAGYLRLSPDPRNTAPIPYIVPALLAVALPRLRLDDVWAWRLAGLGFALAIAAVWGGTLVGIVAAAPLMAVAAPIGGWVADLVRMPDRRVLRLGVVVGIVLPVMTGAADLYVRTRTP